VTEHPRQQEHQAAQQRQRDPAEGDELDDAAQDLPQAIEVEGRDRREDRGDLNQQEGGHKRGETAHRPAV
jgi:hypothetical protein